MHTLLFHEPGHFHAALLLATRNARVDPSVHVYATPGPDLDRFVALIDGFNSRADTPTDWRLRLHTGPEPLRRLIDERLGTIVVVAGRNEPKLAAIAQLHAAGFDVLADKPWLTTSAALNDLAQATSGPPVVADLMTQRHDPVARLRRHIVATETVFGRFLADVADPIDGGDALPALEFASVHHLCKLVDGRPLQRPAWYYDVRVQGDGLVDIQSHNVDQAQWLLEASRQVDPAQQLDSIQLDAAMRWSTPVPLDVFAESTGLDAFPPSQLAEVQDGVLQLACNGQIDYRLAGVRVRQRAEWHGRTPVDGGDTHHSVARGTGAVVTVEHGPSTGNAPQLHVGPGPSEQGVLVDRLAVAVEAWQSEFPGLGMRPSRLGYELLLPPSAHVAHEESFAIVLDEFLDRVDSGGWLRSAATTIRSRYDLLARAQATATDLDRPPST
jgi:predicted dehydrogenase